MQRLKVLEEAIRHPQTDADTRRQQAQTVQAEAQVTTAWGGWVDTNATPRRFFGTVAWLMIVYGSVLLGLEGAYGQCSEDGVMSVALGLAILALPHVFRELDARAQKT